MDSPAGASVVAPVEGCAHRAYDPGSIRTVRGQILSVGRVTPAPGREGVHAVLRTDDGETLSIHFGPAWFLEKEGFVPSAGGTLEVTGSRVILEGAPALIARKIAMGEKELVLRDEAGIPRWSAARGRGSPAEPSKGANQTTALSDGEKQALRDALDDEYRAWATYGQVILDFGPQRPFTNIRDAEATHIDALRVLFVRYGLEVPENDWPGRVPRYANIREACEAGVQSEIDNAAIYDRLLLLTSRPDIQTVFRNLQSASKDRHLPAFRRCASRGGAGGK